MYSSYISLRYVSSDLKSAAKDSTGVCLTASDSAPDNGDCERVENCYWEAVESGKPRARKYTDDEAAAARKTTKSYMMNLGYVVAPGWWCMCTCCIGMMTTLKYFLHYVTWSAGIILGVGSFLGFLIVALVRCCCYRCGVRPREEGYSRCQRWTPIMFYVVSNYFFVVSISGNHCAARDNNQKMQAKC